MKINPDSPDFEPHIDSTATPSQAGKAFGDTLASKSQPKAAAPSAQALSKEELADPAKANAAIDQAIQELMEKQFNGMCLRDREQVGAWLRSDPMIRAALLQRLTA